MTELGQTTDPKQLVPGEPEAVHAAASTVAERGRQLDAIGDGLSQVQIPGWEGQASAAFWQTFSSEIPNWRKASDAMATASNALTSYATALSWAQGQAAEAIALWERGEEITRRVIAMYQQYAAQAPGYALAMLPSSDPGEPLRRRAQEILNQARQQLEEVGQEAARVVDEAAGSGGDSPSWLAKALDVVNTAIRDYQLGSSELKAAFDSGFPVNEESMRRWGDPVGDRDDDPVSWKVKLAELSGEADVWDAGAEGSTNLGPLQFAGKTELEALGVDGTASLAITDRGIAGELSGDAHLLKGTAEGSMSLGPAEVGASGEGYVGAEGKVEGSIGWDGVHVGGEAFAGAKIEGEVHADVGGIGAGIGAEGWAGVGVSGDATFGMHDGKFTIGGEIGAGLGLGGKIGGEITVDPAKVIDTVNDAAVAIGDGVDWAMQNGRDLADTIGEGVGSAVDSGRDLADRAWDSTLGRVF